MSTEEECAAIRDQLSEGPISPEEYRSLLFVRKSGKPPPATAWSRLFCRFHALFPNTCEREMWHEAGHAVVGHVLGCQIRRIRRDHEGVVAVVARRSDGWTDLDVAAMTVAGWLAEALKMAPEYTDPTLEVWTIANEFRMPTGEQPPVEERVKAIEVAEHHAYAILDANWNVVERIALRGMQRLPIEKDELRRLLKGSRRPSS